MRTIDWSMTESGTAEIVLVDQTLLPGETRMRRDSTVNELIEDIRRLAVRGAPALGVAGAFGVALALRNNPSREAAMQEISRLRNARPTAVNLAWGVDQALAALDQGFDAVLEAAIRVRDEDIEASARMAQRGADLLRESCAKQWDNGLTIMTICNTGALAAVEGGTALGVVAEVHRRGHLHQVIACETRPLFQGARLTAWELTQMGASFRTIVDSAANFILARGGVDAVIVGADRIAANGDAANKIGTFSLSLGASHSHVPFIVVAPESTIDLRTANGDEIEIEDRGTEEVVVVNGTMMSPEGTQSINPAFDVTPASHITYIVTDQRTIDTGAGEMPKEDSANALAPQS